MKATRDYFNSVASTYLKKSNRGFWNLVRKLEWRGVEKLLPKFDLGRVLELGSGAGFYSGLLSQKGYRQIVCVDFSQSMLDQIQLENCEKVLANAEDYKNPKKFDLIFVGGLLEFLSHPEKIFENSSSMLKNDGMLVILFPRHSFFGFFYRKFHALKGLKVRLFRKNDLQDWSTVSGLKLSQTSHAALFSCVAKFVKQRP